MTLTLAIGGGGRLDDGTPGELVLNRRGAVVGRAATCDWSLPDPSRHISSRHFEIRYEGGGYVLIDQSTNGTVLAASGERLHGAHRIVNGDRFQVGPFLVTARLTGDAVAPAPGIANDAPPAWAGWDAPAPSTAAEPASEPASGWGASASGWDPPPPAQNGGAAGWQAEPAGPSLARPEPHRAGALANSPPAVPHRSGGAGWVPEAAAALPPVRSAWQAETSAPDPASAWSSAAPDRAPAPSPDDLWGRIADGNVVDWARGGFGQPVEPPRDPLGLSPDPSHALPRERPAPPPPAPPPPPPVQPPAVSADAFATAAGLPAGSPAIGDHLLDRAGGLFRRLVAGLVVMVEARARAKAQLGAEATAFSPEGHNPLKFARTPDEAMAMLLGPPQPGFMPPEQAVEDAFRDLQSHQVATLRAMQGALRTTLDRFSPTAIRARADAGGMIERIVPAARDAALWQAYQREFGGVAQGSDEAFLDVFAKEFRRAYNEQAAGRR